MSDWTGGGVKCLVCGVFIAEGEFDSGMLEGADDETEYDCKCGRVLEIEQRISYQYMVTGSKGAE